MQPREGRALAPSSTIDGVVVANEREKDSFVSPLPDRRVGAVTASTTTHRIQQSDPARIAVVSVSLDRQARRMLDELLAGWRR